MALRASTGLKTKLETGLDILIYTDLLDRSDLGKTGSFVYSLLLGFLASSGNLKSIDKWRIKEEL